MSSNRFRLYALLLPVVFLLASCVDMDAEVEIRPDLSGSITLEYRISRMVESMGKLDGNERRLPLPVGEEDFRRTVARVSGLSLKSYSSQTNEEDVVVKTELGFANPAALVAFLDATGRSVRYVQNGEKRSLTLRLAEGGGKLDPELETLVRTVFKDYRVDLRIKTPGVPTSSAPGVVDAAEKSASVSYATADLLASSERIEWEITWK